MKSPQRAFFKSPHGTILTCKLTSEAMNCYTWLESIYSSLKFIVGETTRGLCSSTESFELHRA